MVPGKQNDTIYTAPNVNAAPSIILRTANNTCDELYDQGDDNNEGEFR